MIYNQCYAMIYFIDFENNNNNNNNNKKVNIIKTLYLFIDIRY
jgi:hypothetical protein